jgi:hypothetical protein
MGLMGRWHCFASDHMEEALGWTTRGPCRLGSERPERDALMRAVRRSDQAGNFLVLPYQELGSRCSISHRLFTDAASIAWSEASRLARCHRA